MKNKRRIAFVSNTMCVGGVERVLVELLKHLDYDRYSVTLYLRNADGELLPEIDERVNIKYWGQAAPGTQPWELMKKGRLFSVIKGVWYRVLARLYSNDWALNESYAVKSFPREDGEAYDCVIAYHGATAGVLSAALYRLNSRKKIVWIHGRDPYPEGDRTFFEKEYGKFDRVFAVSRSIADTFAKRYPKASGAITVSYNLIDQERIKAMAVSGCPSFRSTSLLTVGRLVAVKGQQMIPHTARLLLDAGYDIHWYLVGDGPLREEIERESEKYQVSDRVILLGTQMNPYPYIKNCDIYVQPSFSEGYCTTTVEAKILQKPIVTTDAPGMREQFVNGENGIIVDSMSPTALSTGIKQLLCDTDMRNKLAQNLEKEAFDNSEEMQKLYDAIEN